MVKTLGDYEPKELLGKVFEDPLFCEENYYKIIGINILKNTFKAICYRCNHSLRKQSLDAHLNNPELVLSNF